MRIPLIAFFLAGLAATPELPAQEKAPDPKTVVAKAIAAVGGEEKRLKLFRIQERFNFGETEAAPDKGSKRESVIEPPKYWWIGKKDRGVDPAKSDVWGWTLGVLLDPKSVIESIPGVKEGEKMTVGLRVSESVAPMELYFDAETYRLIRMDFMNDIFRFSEWREVDGAGYAAKSVILKKGTGKPWFYHEITKLEPLKDLPEGISR